jgi:hypothetical protein
MARGLYLTTVTQKHSKPMRMFAVANVSETARLRVPEATREEIHSQLKHYAASKGFLMLPTEDSVDAFAVEYYKTISSGRFREVLHAATLQT